jgi:hypothetical protein
MAFDPSTLTDYSWSDIAKAAKASMVASAMGGNTISVNGRNLGRISIDEAKKLYELATQMVADEAAASTGTDGGLALVQFGERQ